MVIWHSVVNPAVPVESARAATPFFRGEVGMTATVRTVPSIVSAWATKPSSDFVVLWPTDAFWVRNFWWVRDIDDPQSCVPVRDVEKFLPSDWVDVEDVVVVENGATTCCFWFRRVAAPAKDLAAVVLLFVGGCGVP